MRIERLQIHGFGRLKDQDISIDPGITIFMGPNEAGKSTVQQFVRAMFFGIPSRTYPTERYEPLSGGVHGGILTLIDDMDTRWTISRFTSTSERASHSNSRMEKNSIVKSEYNGQVQQVSQQEMERELLGGLSRNMFNQLFAISLSELQEMRSLQSDEMSSYLFHAGIGGGNEIVQAERKLTQQMEKLYKPKGRVQEISKVLQSIEQLEKEISNSRSFLKRYNDNATTRIETVELLETQGQTRHIAAQRLLLLNRAKEIRPTWLKWTEARLQRLSLPEILTFPTEGIARWDSLQGESNIAHLRQAKLLRNQSEWQAQLDVLHCDQFLDEQGVAIDRLIARRETYEAKTRDLLELQAESSMLDLRLQRIIRQIDSSWTNSDLAKFSTSVGEREAVRRYSEGFTSYDRRIENLASQTEQLRQQLNSSEMMYGNVELAYEEKLDHGRGRFTMLIPQRPEEMTEVWNVIIEAVDRWRENRMVRLSSMGQVESDKIIHQRWRAITRGFLWGSCIVTLVIPIFVWNMGYAIPAIISMIALLIVVTVLLWNGILKPTAAPPRGRRTESLVLQEERQDIEDVVKLISRLINKPIHKTGNGISNGEPILATELETNIRELRKLIDEWFVWQQNIDKLRNERKPHEDRIRTLTLELTIIEEKMVMEERKFIQLGKEWEQWLQQRDLHCDLSPEAVLDMYGLAEQALDHMDQLNKINRKVQQLDKDCQDYEIQCKNILPEGPVEDERSLITRMEWMKNEWDQYQEVISQRKLIIAKVETLEEEMKLVSDELNRISSLEQELIMLGEADHGEDFLRRGAVHKQIEQLSKDILQLEVSMFSGIHEDTREMIIRILDTHDETALEQACEQSEAQCKVIEGRWNDLQQTHGRLLQERDQLELQCLQDTAIQQLEEQKATLKEMITDYAVMSICSEMISKTRQIYEEEKQPQVLKLASTYFEQLTNGAYSRIVMKMGGKELLAEHRDQAWMESAKLSRGTAEQMYLALRLALANTMNSDVSIPLLFDDILVNFDEQRMIKALSLLNEISTTRQIIMMTCHPYVAQHMRDIMPNAQFISLQPSI
ncbi:AAA family ATPase [Paenibacillus sp. CMAA1364]